ncbi:MAG: hypothetical protein MHM6MM_001893 [Cercozoa sp. M6MM]
MDLDVVQIPTVWRDALESTRVKSDNWQLPSEFSPVSHKTLHRRAEDLPLSVDSAFLRRTEALKTLNSTTADSSKQSYLLGEPRTRAFSNPPSAQHRFWANDPSSTHEHRHQTTKTMHSRRLEFDALPALPQVTRDYTRLQSPDHEHQHKSHDPRVLPYESVTAESGSSASSFAGRPATAQYAHSASSRQHREREHSEHDAEMEDFGLAQTFAQKLALRNYVRCQKRRCVSAGLRRLSSNARASLLSSHTRREKRWKEEAGAFRNTLLRRSRKHDEVTFSIRRYAISKVVATVRNALKRKTIRVLSKLVLRKQKARLQRAYNAQRFARFENLVRFLHSTASRSALSHWRALSQQQRRRHASGMLCFQWRCQRLMRKYTQKMRRVNCRVSIQTPAKSMPETRSIGLQTVRVSTKDAASGVKEHCRRKRTTEVQTVPEVWNVSYNSDNWRHQRHKLRAVMKWLLVSLVRSKPLCKFQVPSGITDSTIKSRNPLPKTQTLLPALVQDLPPSSVHRKSPRRAFYAFSVPFPARRLLALRRFRRLITQKRRSRLLHHREALLAAGEKAMRRLKRRCLWIFRVDAALAHRKRTRQPPPVTSSSSNSSSTVEESAPTNAFVKQSCESNMHNKSDGTPRVCTRQRMKPTAMHLETPQFVDADIEVDTDDMSRVRPVSLRPVSLRPVSLRPDLNSVISARSPTTLTLQLLPHRGLSQPTAFRQSTKLSSLRTVAPSRPMRPPDFQAKAFATVSTSKVDDNQLKATSHGTTKIEKKEARSGFNIDLTLEVPTSVWRKRAFRGRSQVI